MNISLNNLKNKVIYFRRVIDSTQVRFSGARLYDRHLAINGRTGMNYQHILVAVDLTPSSQVVIDKAISLAKGTNCKVSFVFVDVNSVFIAPREEHKIEHELQVLAKKSGYPITDTLVVMGDLHIKLSGVVKKMGIDLVVCGHHHNFLSRLFSSVPKLANAVEADLLVVYLKQ